MARVLSGECDENSKRSCSRFVCLGNFYKAIGNLFDRLVHGRFYLVWVTFARRLKSAKHSVARYALYLGEFFEKRFYFLLRGALGDQMSAVGRARDGP